jgi:dolichol-phosphate mannosyltransferase
MGVDAEVIELTATEDESLRMLEDGELDAYVTVDFFTDPGRAVPMFKVGYSDFFFAVSKKRPELLPELINLWESGYDIVQTIRETTEGVSFVKNLTSKAYYRFLNLLAEKPVRPGGSDFRLMDRQAVLAMRQFREHSRFIRGLVSSLGFRQTTIHFTAPPRFAGVSKFSPRKMFHLAVDGILSQTIKPLRFAFWAGSLSALLCLCFIIYALVSYVEHHAVAGWTSMLAVLSFIGSLQLFLLGIIGEYLGHSFIEGRHRPLYLIRKPDPTRPDIL